MTKEELKKEAEEFENKNSYYESEGNINTPCRARKVCKVSIKDAYFAGAQSREHQITVLSKHIIDLQKDKGDLIDEVRGLKDHLRCLITGMYHIAQHHPTMGAHTKIMRDLREAEDFLGEVEK